MNLKKLFDTQAKLDEHIYEKHPELRGQNNLDWKILALQVELGECANEWRGFKKWSNDQEPRGQGTYLEYGCKCEGMANRWVEKNPLLEEYVDCFHFILSIGLEMEMHFEETLIWEFENTQDVINLFHEVIAQTADLFWDYKNKYETASTYKAVLNHFIKLGEELGFSWEQVESAYFTKNQINHKRQESGY